MHTLWLREHNRVANILFAHFGTAKSDEYYYQETRRIVIAEFQHIVYNEYLTVLVGTVCNKHRYKNFINKLNSMENLMMHQVLVWPSGNLLYVVHLTRPFSPNSPLPLSD